MSMFAPYKPDGSLNTSPAPRRPPQGFQVARPSSPPVPPQRTTHHTQSADEILPGLWIGGQDAARDADFLRRFGITAVLNATQDIPNYFICARQPPEIEYMRIPVNDSLQEGDIQKMTRYMPHAASFIYKNRDLGGANVLVHCAAGMQRSASIVALYLHYYNDLPLAQAMELVVRQRRVAFAGGSHINFRASLERLQRF